MKKVVKFGGSSLASAKQFKKVGDISPDVMWFRLHQVRETTKTRK